MKKLLAILVLGLLLVSCDQFSPKTYLLCTDGYSKSYAGFDKKNIYLEWLEIEKDFDSIYKITSQNDAYIYHKDSKIGLNIEINREEGMLRRWIDAYGTTKKCKKIKKNQLPTKKVKQKF